MRDILARVEPGVFGLEGIELLRTELPPKFLIFFRLLIDFVGEIPRHQNESPEAFVNACKKPADGGVVAVAHVCQAMRIDVGTCQKQICASAHVHDLLYQIRGSGVIGIGPIQRCATAKSFCG